MQEPQSITPVDVNKLREKGDDIVLIDVRTKEEFAECHAAGAINIPLDEIDANKAVAAGASPDKPVYIICKSGGRSFRAGQMLIGEGFKQVFNVETGTMGWTQAGLPATNQVGK